MDRSYKDMPSLEAVFTTLSLNRLMGLFTEDESIELAGWILGQKPDTKYEALNELRDYYDPLTISSNVTLEGSDSSGRQEGLKWETSIATWSYSPINQSFDASKIIRQILHEISTHCSLEFSETADRDANIHINWLGMALPVGKVGVRYTPATGQRLYLSPLAGDITLDTDAKWKEGEYFKTVMRFELGRSVGMPVSQDQADLLYPSFEQFRTYQAGDIAVLQSLYP